MRAAQIYLLAGSLLFIVFTLFSFFVDINIFKQLDFDFTVKLQDSISRRFDNFFSWFSVLGMFEVTLIILLAILVLKRKIFAGITGFTLFVLFHIIEIFGKTIVENIPPPEFMLRTKRLIEFPQFHVRAEYSYPSGHSGRTVFLSVIIIISILQSGKLPPILKAALITGILVFNFIMLLSRIYLGEHWATDVIGGAILGLSFALICSSLYKQKPIKFTKNPRQQAFNN